MDVVGRGESDWLEHKEDYGFDVYVADAAALIARLTAPQLPSAMGRLWPRLARPHVPRVDWIGTSMGGLLGMMLAAKRNTPIRHLVLNDVGPLLFGVDLRPAWNAVQCPTLVIRGGESDLLLPSTVEQMLATNPLARVVELPGIGHAPWLASDEQLAIVRDFLGSPVLP